MRLAFICFLIAALGVARAAPQAATEEINYLIGYIENSGARFLRNGKEYTAKEAADHMRDKLAHAGGRVKTAEDFIKGIASKSYLSGQPYRVKFSDGSIVDTGPWLAEALARHRAQ